MRLAPAFDSLRASLVGPLPIRVICAIRGEVILAFPSQSFWKAGSPERSAAPGRDAALRRPVVAARRPYLIHEQTKTGLSSKLGAGSLPCISRNFPPGTFRKRWWQSSFDGVGHQLLIRICNTFFRWLRRSTAINKIKALFYLGRAEANRERIRCAIDSRIRRISGSVGARLVA